jgi:cbb3-type cytochrome oxidase cytochrome c subunit
MTSRIRLFGLAVVVAGTLSAMWGSAVAPAAAQDPALVDEGQKAFMSQGCYGCHTIKAMGTEIGPDLSRVGARHSEEYLAKWLRDPASQKPSAHMPKLELTKREIKALTAFLSAQQ